MKQKSHNQAVDATPAALDERAARWSERLRAPDADAGTRAAFEAWLAGSPARSRAFARAQAAHVLAGALAGAPRLQALRDETRARVQRHRRRRWAVALAASVLLAVGAGWLGSRQMVPDGSIAMPTLLAGGERYRTGVGQRTVVRLDDGSVITLNTDSRVRVRYSQGRREVALERGQAMFQVAKDRSRPFVVSAGDRWVTALGTRFDVLLSPRALEVTLLEGRVVVTGRPRAPADGAQRTELAPGQQFVESAKAPPQVRRADLGRVASWVDGQLVFRDERLAAAVEQMNRYSRRKIVLDDPRLDALRLSGAFNSGDVDAFVSALTDYFPIERVRRDDDAVVLRMRVLQAAGDGTRPVRR